MSSCIRAVISGLQCTPQHAARIVHDGSIGIGDALHLFRLPQQMQRTFDDLLQKSEIELRKRFEQIIDDPNALLTELDHLRMQMPRERRRGAVGAGPLRVGGLAMVQEQGLAAQLAGPYLAAFSAGVKVFPYLADHGLRT